MNKSHFETNNEYKQQIAHGRRVNGIYDGNTSSEQPSVFHQKVKKGHMAYLGHLQNSETTIECTTVLGEKHIGVLKAFDEETISLRVATPNDNNLNAYRTYVLMKTNLVEFAPIY